MAVQFDTTRYEWVHGKAPKGRGSWAFTRKASHGMEEDTFFSPSWMTYAEARTWARKQVQAQGFQDATVEVGA